ncbi:EF hand [Teladorsagia circumcincta]|uniref:EF hand n=1 Tax=Teladorsagia circumcincta TaxID=45464 RepID=A0A2G9U5Z0_TELCI|nr:EF hand [Teladorsagia circumcincta]
MLEETLCDTRPRKGAILPVTDIVEVRSGYSTDNLHKAAKKYEFQEAAPDRDRWVSALTYLISKVREQRAHLNEQTWILQKFREADTNKNGTLSFNELWLLLKKMNLEISEKYARAMFREAEEKSTRDGVLDENEFLRFFDCLTERPELHHVLRMASSEGVEGVTVADLQKFLTEEQDRICYELSDLCLIEVKSCLGGEEGRYPFSIRLINFLIS